MGGKRTGGRECAASPRILRRRKRRRRACSVKIINNGNSVGASNLIDICRFILKMTVIMILYFGLVYFKLVAKLPNFCFCKKLLHGREY